ncbi:MAG: PQQ-dependent sugar dehydrogenase [Thermoproteota archaeon]|nr:PQQ-dependent sugar dehydrogenase [Thermoproteota archaeon]
MSTVDDRMQFKSLVAAVAFLLILVSGVGNIRVFGQPMIKDAGLKVEQTVQGLLFPTSMLFLDADHIFVLEKEGKVRLVLNGVLQQEPILSLSVVNKNERGLLGIEKIGQNVFLYVTESDGGAKNRVYKYALEGTSLSKPTLILDLPAGPGTNHQGGKLVSGKDNSLYSVTGELQRNGKDQNIKHGPDPDFSGAILRVNSDNGSPAPNNPFSKSNSSSDPLAHYYAYGIRNSFGLSIDPVTGSLWDTENGEDVNDEINIVTPGLNSGWKLVMGPISRSGISETQLVNFPGSKYSDPVLSFKESIGITDIEFLGSNKLGDKYTNNAFVGDINNGNVYFFQMNESRNGFNLASPGLNDKVVDNSQEQDSVVWGTGFGGITDIETGPDGYLYVLSYENGAIYKISPS